MTTLEQLKSAKNASRILRMASTKQKDLFLAKLADLVEKNQEQILVENVKDLANASDITPAMKKRLALSASSIQAIAQGVRDIIKLSDPVGQIVGQWERPNGMKVGKMRVPIGVIFFVFESRPNVIIDAAALAIKAGNVLIARGGKEAKYSNDIFEKIIMQALAEAGLPKDCATQLGDKSHEGIYEVLKYSEYVDLAVARGREQLINSVKEHARMPVIAHERGLCHIYIDEFADLEKAVKITINAKVSNPAVCNSAEVALVHEKVAEKVLPGLISGLIEKGVEVRGDKKVCAVDKRCSPAGETDWDTEFLALIMAVKVVKDLDEALLHIDKHGSRHSDTIVTENEANADRFVHEINNAATLVNASTRLVDGGVFGLGAEFGISTASIHMRGPMGLEDLTVTKYFVLGDGQVRE